MGARKSSSAGQHNELSIKISSTSVMGSGLTCPWSGVEEPKNKRGLFIPHGKGEAKKRCKWEYLQGRRAIEMGGSPLGPLGSLPSLPVIKIVFCLYVSAKVRLPPSLPRDQGLCLARFLFSGAELFSMESSRGQKTSAHSQLSHHPPAHLSLSLTLLVSAPRSPRHPLAFAARRCLIDHSLIVEQTQPLGGVA